MKTLLTAYLGAAAAFVALDSVWLTVVGSKLYRPKIGHLMADSVNFAPAVVFYLVFLAGIVYFAVLPALAEGRLATAAVRGTALGFLCYATYDLTNHATLKGWPLSITLADLAWGTFLTAAAASAGFWAAQRFGD